MQTDAREIYPEADSLARAAAAKLTGAARESIAARGVFTLALAGGSTPKRLYQLLAGDAAFRDFPWAQTQLFFGDERHVPPDHPESNYRMVKEALLKSGLVPEKNVHRVEAEESDAKVAAGLYDDELHRFFSEAMRLNQAPRFDVILLGMGPDGHTASLFPDTPALDETSLWVVANPVMKFDTDRITFTYPVLNAARAVWLLVAGAEKAPMIREVLGEGRDYPVQRVRPVDGVKAWLLDEAAAAELKP